MVQTKVLETIGNKGLKAYAVWEPILRTDNARAARRSTILIKDPRVEHFWTPTTHIGEAFQAPLALKGEPAWDVYLVYREGVGWEGHAPPRPDYFMHQLGPRLPEDRSLDGERLAERLNGELKRK